jgi:hypothetical protein
LRQPRFQGGPSFARRIPITPAFRGARKGDKDFTVLGESIFCFQEGRLGVAYAPLAEQRASQMPVGPAKARIAANDIAP